MTSQANKTMDAAEKSTFLATLDSRARLHMGEIADQWYCTEALCHRGGPVNISVSCGKCCL